MPREETQYAGQAGDSPAPTIETALSTAVLLLATPVEEHAEDEAERAAAAALAIPHTSRTVAVATITDRLLTRIEGLAVGIERIPVCRRGVSGVGALAKWQMLTANGPAADPLGNWSYMRELAHVTRDMVRVLREHRAAEQSKAFVGRIDRPPLAPGTG
ncbi:hypothetical protein ACFQ7J_07185 [Streptomyces sp. NPDC056501]|uniref:hypothetical protein n=1 Tax=Streptomyces sp. NPDC056501 TaxID=3345841 RepID=UPI0036A734D8